MKVQAILFLSQKSTDNKHKVDKWYYMAKSLELRDCCRMKEVSANFSTERDSQLEYKTDYKISSRNSVSQYLLNKIILL